MLGAAANGGGEGGGGSEARPRGEPVMPSCNISATRDVVDPAVSLTYPAWLVGRGGREINPKSSAEVALGRSIAACAHEVGWTPEGAGWVVPPPSGGGGGASAHNHRTQHHHLAALEYTPVVTDAGLLSRQYDRAQLGLEPPGEPAFNADITLAIFVILPEAIVLVTLLLTNALWGQRDWLAFLLF